MLTEHLWVPTSMKAEIFAINGLTTAGVCMVMSVMNTL